MNTFDDFRTTFVYEKKSFVRRIADDINNPLYLALNGRKIEVIKDNSFQEGKKPVLGYRILGAIISALIIPLLLVTVPLKLFRREEDLSLRYRNFKQISIKREKNSPGTPLETAKLDVQISVKESKKDTAVSSTSTVKMETKKERKDHFVPVDKVTANAVPPEEKRGGEQIIGKEDLNNKDSSDVPDGRSYLFQKIQDINLEFESWLNDANEKNSRINETLISVDKHVKERKKYNRTEDNELIYEHIIKNIENLVKKIHQNKGRAANTIKIVSTIPTTKMVKELYLKNLKKEVQSEDTPSLVELYKNLTIDETFLESNLSNRTLRQDVMQFNLIVDKGKDFSIEQYITLGLRLQILFEDFLQYIIELNESNKSKPEDKIKFSLKEVNNALKSTLTQIKKKKKGSIDVHIHTDDKVYKMDRIQKTLTNLRKRIKKEVTLHLKHKEVSNTNLKKALEEFLNALPEPGTSFTYQNKEWPMLKTEEHNHLIEIKNELNENSFSVKHDESQNKDFAYATAKVNILNSVNVMLEPLTS